MLLIKIIIGLICFFIVLEIGFRIWIDPYAPDSKDEKVETEKVSRVLTGLTKKDKS